MRTLLVLMVAAVLSFGTFAKKFSNETELGMVITGGNSDTKVFNATTLNTYNFSEKSKLSAGGRYTDGSNNGVESVHNWKAFARYDQALNQAWELYVQQNIESDKFSGYAQRYNSDIGAKWNIVKTDKWYTFAELGYRYTVENNVNRMIPLAHFNKARLYYEIGGNVNENVFAKFWAEYLPNFTDSDDWILRFEPSLAIALNKTFSLKLAYRGIYDNQVNVIGNKKFDYIYTTSIIAKF